MIVDNILEYSVQHPEQVVALATGIGAAAEHYRRTGRIPIGRLPYRALRRTLRQLGDQYARTARPRDVPGLVVETDVDQLESALRETAHFEGAGLYSYAYGDEVLNLRRPEGSLADPETGETVPMELHVRAFATEDGRLWVLAHHEASRYEAWGPHLRESVLSWQRGQRLTAAILRDLAIVHGEHRSESAAGVEIVPP